MAKQDDLLDFLVTQNGRINPEEEDEEYMRSRRIAWEQDLKSMGLYDPPQSRPVPLRRWLLLIGLVAVVAWAWAS